MIAKQTLQKHLWDSKHHPIFLLKIAQGFENIEASNLITMTMTIIITVPYFFWTTNSQQQQQQEQQAKILKPYSRDQQIWWSQWSQQQQTEGCFAPPFRYHWQPVKGANDFVFCSTLQEMIKTLQMMIKTLQEMIKTLQEMTKTLQEMIKYSDLVVPIAVSNISENPCIWSLVCRNKTDQVADNV